MNLPLGGELIARAPGWVFELGVYELVLLIGGTVILVGSLALSVGSVREDTGGSRMLPARRWHSHVAIGTTPSVASRESRGR